MVIIEGPEGSGKTQLAQYLAEEVPSNYHHFGGPPQNSEEHERHMNRSRALLEMNFIQDRSPWISDPIYTVLFGDERRINLWPAYTEGLAAMNAKVIYCRPPREIISEKMFNESKSYKSPFYERIVRDNVGRLITLYDQFMEMLNPWIIYDWTRPTTDLADKQLVRRLRRIDNLRRKQLPQSEDQQRRDNSSCNPSK
jgi:adenylate kinase family enzyme